MPCAQLVEFAVPDTVDLFHELPKIITVEIGRIELIYENRSVERLSGCGDDPASDSVPAIDLPISASPESYKSPHDVREMLMLKSETPIASSGSIKKHTELQLLAGMTYRAGDYLTVPKNPRQNVERIVHKLSLPWERSLYIKYTDEFLPRGTRLGIREVLGSYVEFSQLANGRNIKTLMHHTTDAATKPKLHKRRPQQFFFVHQSQEDQHPRSSGSLPGNQPSIRNIPCHAALFKTVSV